MLMTIKFMHKYEVEHNARQENANSVDYILGFPTAYFLLLLHADGARLESYTRESHYSKAIELVKMSWY